MKNRHGIFLAIIFSFTILNQNICGSEIAGYRLDEDVFNHGTYDRIWKPRAIYMSANGELFIPYRGGLQKIQPASLDELFKTTQQLAKLEWRIYINGEAKWLKVKILLEKIHGSSRNVKLRIWEKTPQRGGRE